MNRICAIVLLFPAVLGSQSTLAAASSQCEDISTTPGRSYVTDPCPLAGGAAIHQAILGCPAEQAIRFVIDVKALREATKAESHEKLIGTWVSDDVLTVFSGLFIPVYEVLEISQSEVPAEVRIVQKVLPAYDPATWVKSDAKRSALKNDVTVLLAKQQRIFEKGPLQVLMQESGSSEPIGCPDYR